MDLNVRINKIEECSTNYVHQAEKFQADASHLSSLLERSFIEAEQFISNRMQKLEAEINEANNKIEHEQILLQSTRAKLDSTLTNLIQRHQEAIRLQSNTDSRFRLMVNTARGRLEQIERLKNKLMRYENSLDITSPISEDIDLLNRSKTEQSTTEKFQNELKHVTDQMRKVIDLGKEVRHETQILHGQYDTDADRLTAALMRHEKTEREQLSALIEHKKSLTRDIEWIEEQKKIIDSFITRMAATLDQYLCEGLSTQHMHRPTR